MGSDKEDLARWADLVLDGKPINIDQTIRNQAAHITALEEAVRVLAEEAHAWRTHTDENYYTNALEAARKTDDNTIAAAAVREAGR